MITASARRFVIAASFAAVTFFATGNSFAQGITGTDPCPKNMMCSNAAPAAPKAATSTPATSASSASATSAAVQTLLVLFGLA